MKDQPDDEPAAEIHRLRLALRAADLGTWDYDPRTDVFVCDERFRQMSGIVGEGTLGLAALLAAAHPEDRERLQAAIVRALATRGPGDRLDGRHSDFTLEYRLPGAPNGRERWVSLRGGTFFDGTGTPIRFAGAALDVTVQMGAREDIRRATRRSRLIKDALPQIVWTAEPDGSPSFFNRRWYEYTGFAPDSLVANEWRQVIHPDDLPRITASLARSLAEKVPFAAELRLLRASDRSFRWHQAHSVPVRDESGEITMWVGSSMDIDARKRAEDITTFFADASKVLATSLDLDQTLRNLAQLVVPVIADCCSIYLIDNDDISTIKRFVAHRDPARQPLVEGRGVSPRAPLGPIEAIRSGTPELHREVTDAMLVSVAQDQAHLSVLRALQIRSVMTIPIKAHGKTFGSITFVTAESGRVYDESDLVMAEALAERAAYAIENARLYQDAQDAIRLRDDFLSIASHELKTPLTPLQLHLQWLQKQPKEVLSEKAVHKLSVMGRQVDRLERLVGGLLEISRMTAHRLDLEPEAVDLAALVRDLSQRFGSELAHAKCAFTMAIPAAVVGQWDRIRLEQVVSNLLANAIKFGAGKPIELRIGQSGDIATILVRDHGIGISALDQSRIFRRFERAVSTRHYGGFGLGLWIVRQIIDAMGGSITIDSALGAGATFTVFLPTVPGVTLDAGVPPGSKDEGPRDDSEGAPRRIH